ncbi:MAG: YHYH domain-containing protein [Acidiferrobacterales bacterium]|nr:YHYH domain-containing protein [Acidiferrobacterales bacterium]
MKLWFVIATMIITTQSAQIAHGANQKSERFQTFHGGGTDKCGCHYNRKTGEYHCHTRKQRGGDCPS